MKQAARRILPCFAILIIVPRLGWQATRWWLETSIHSYTFYTFIHSIEFPQNLPTVKSSCALLYLLRTYTENARHLRLRHACRQMENCPMSAHHTSTQLSGAQSGQKNVSLVCLRCLGPHSRAKNRWMRSRRSCVLHWAMSFKPRHWQRPWHGCTEEVDQLYWHLPRWTLGFKSHQVAFSWQS